MQIRIKHNQPCLDLKDQQAVSKAVASGSLAEGPITQTFERTVANYLQRKFAKATSSGSAALHLALLSLGVGKGDEVIISTYACTALLNAISYVGATPKITDIDDSNLGMSVASAKKLLSKKTKAIIVHHTFGFPARIQSLKSLGIPIIEDCAQSLGTFIGERPAGSFGDLTICSFYATKMTACGYGGMVLTDNSKWAGIIRDLSNYDQRKEYRVRYNYGLSDVLAALGLSQFGKLNSFLKHRKEIASQYIKTLNHTDFYFWQGDLNTRPNFYRFITGGTKPFPYYQKKLAGKGVQVISPLAPYQLLHRYLNMDPKKYPAAETISRFVFSLPIYPALNHSTVSKICRSLNLLE